MQILNLISLLLDYPEDNSAQFLLVVRNIIAQTNLTPANQESIGQLLDHFHQHSLLDLQSAYDASFERGRTLSLHLFEHIHGESRDRGQAMVDLQQQYRAAGLDIGVKELPDYLPLYLEFLSTQGEENARIGLEEVAPILALLACRLEKRNSPYASLFHCLLLLSGAAINLDDIHRQLHEEKRDDTPEALDKVWEDEMVTFGADQGADSCSSNTSRPTTQQRKDDIEYLGVDDFKNLRSASCTIGS